MIPSDITITPLSGSGDSSVSMTMEEYTGRVAKPTREVWVYDTDDTVSDMVEIDQYPKTEFIGLNDPLTFSVVALGGEITVTGISNSSVLRPVEFDEALEFELSINGKVQSSWSPDNPVITGDIGADEEYSFSLKVTVPENQSTSQKPWTFQLSNNAQIVTATITINQAAGVRTYSSITVSEFSYPVASAAGGILTPTLSYSQTWGWNGQTTGGGTITSGAVLSYEATAGYWAQEDLDTSTGIITAPSRGTVISNQQYELDVRVSVSLNGKNALQYCSVQQAENLPVSIVVTPSFTYPTGNIPASGGTKAPTPTGSINITWSSGEIGPADESGNSGYSTVRSTSWEMTSAEGFSINSSTGIITAGNRSTTVGNERSCGNVTRTLTVTLTIDGKYGGGTVSDTGEYTLNSPVTQEANVQTLSTVTIEENHGTDSSWYSGDWDSIPARVIFLPIIGYKHYSYTSGSTSSERVVDYEATAPSDISVVISSSATDWAHQSSSNYYKCSIRLDSRGTVIGNERSGSVHWVIEGISSNELSFTQVKNVPVSGETTQAGFSYPDNVIPPAGGSVYAESSGAFRLTWSSGATSYPSQSTEDVSYVASTVYTMAATEGFSIFSSNGRITATGMGSTLGSRSCGNVTRVLHYTVTISDTYGGGSFDTTSFTKVLTSPVTQGVNERIYHAPVITLGTPSDIPASGGTISSVPILSVIQPFHYTSGTTATDRNPTRTNEVWTPVTAPSKGSTITGRTVAGELEYSCFCNGVQGSATVNVYQEANEPESADFWSLDFDSSIDTSIPYTEGIYTINPNNTSAGGADIHYTSGASRMSDTTIRWSSEVTRGSSWITKLSEYNWFRISENTDFSSRSGTIEFTAVQTIPGMEFLGSSVQSGNTTVSQAAQPVQLYFDETSIPTVPEEGGEVFLTIHSNVQWGFYTGGVPAATAGIRDKGSTGTFAPLAESEVSTPNAPGDYEIRLYYNSNQETYEKDLFVTVFSLNPEATTQLSGVQEAASTYLEVAPVSLEFEQSGGILTIKISSNTSWEIDGTVNPDLQPNIQIIGTEHCINCGECDPAKNPNIGPVPACPVGTVLEYSDELNRFEVVNSDSCILCGSCVEGLSKVCPVYDATGETGVGIKLKSQN